MCAGGRRVMVGCGWLRRERKGEGSGSGCDGGGSGDESFGLKGTESK